MDGGFLAKLDLQWQMEPAMAYAELVVFSSGGVRPGNEEMWAGFWPTVVGKPLST